MRFSILIAIGSAATALMAQTATLRPEVTPREDPKLRAEAVGLLERANRVSIPAIWPANEMALHFHVLNPAVNEAAEGTYTSSFGGPGLRRQETEYGDYRLTQIRNGNHFYSSPVIVGRAAILNRLPEITPISLGRFDHEDIIRSIANGSIADSRCIQFETLFGDRQQANEICVDQVNGYLLSFKQGDVTIRNSRFFEFAGAFLPGHVERWIGDQKEIEVDQAIAAKNDYPKDFFVSPAGASATSCGEFRRAFAQNTPQPDIQTSSPNVTDVTLQGLISTDGHVIGLKPIDTANPDLADEAVKLVSQWTFSPATCNGNPVGWPDRFVVHFKGR